MDNNFPNSWKLLPLENCMEAIIDYRGKTPRKSSFGIPLITAKIVKGGRILEPNEFIPVEDYDDRMQRGIPKAGDIVVTTEAPLGEVGQLDGRKLSVGQRLITLRGKDGLLDNTFLKFLLMSEFVQNQIQARGTGTTVIGIKQKELRKISLPLPPIDEQRAIARILGALDDKIELNRRMNRTLEEMARALFKAWFVDFDPVAAKAEGRLPFGMRAETAALFPAEFEETASEDFPVIPKGWAQGTFGDIAENIRRGISPKNIAPDMPYIGLEHMPRKDIALSEWGWAGDVTSNKFEFKKGEILFGKLRPYFHKVGVASVDGVCSTDVLVVSPKSPEYFGLLLGHVSSVDFVNFVDAASEGTKMPRTNWETMARFPIAIPGEKLSEAFTRTITPMIGRIHANISESRTLAAIRDALLPKLLSGEVRVNNGYPKGTMWPSANPAEERGASRTSA
ncbi:MAG: restriction endonuclease subunit S [Anaerolineales bacterium]